MNHLLSLKVTSSFAYQLTAKYGTTEMSFLEKLLLGQLQIVVKYVRKSYYYKTRKFDPWGEVEFQTSTPQ